MQKRCLGETGIAVSVMGLGTVKLGRNEGVKYPQPFDLPTDQEIQTLLGVASELGINLLDTAPAYGVSEERLGRLLRGQRKDWIISTKAGETFVAGASQFDFSEKAIVSSVERSLKRLQTDYLDILLVHSNGEDEHLIQKDGVFETLNRLKKQGKIRAVGMSTKTVQGGLLTIQQADVAMVTYHPDYTEEGIVIEKAHQARKSIFIKKAFASGHLLHPVSHYLKFVLAEAGVTSVIVGTINPAHLRENVESTIVLGVNF